MVRSKKGGPGIRLLRVGENIRHALADILLREELHEPALHDASITVSEVRVSADLRYADVFVVPLGGENQEEVVEALNRSAPYLGSLLGKQVIMKFSPRLRFQLDQTFDESSRIESLLSQPRVARDLKKK